MADISLDNLSELFICFSNFGELDSESFSTFNNLKKITFLNCEITNILPFSKCQSLKTLILDGTAV